MSYSLEEKIRRFAIFSRIIIILLQFVSNFLIPDHDAGVFQKPLDPNITETKLDRIVGGALGGFSRWDAQYFLHVAEYGYTYENTLAFFPAFPFIIRQVTYFILYIVNNLLGSFLPCRDIISMHNALLLVAVVINNCVFVKTSLTLYKLSLAVLKDEKLSYISAILFCVNPASIFFSAAYSESFYCFFVFFGLLNIETKNSILNYILIGLSGVTRSNGLINTGFIAYKYMKLKVNKNLNFFFNIIFSFGLFLSILPFLLYQGYCCAKYCIPNKVALPNFIFSHGIENCYVFPGSNSSWCSWNIPFAYSYVQDHYWNVGFLKYYQFKQIPNFILAAPIVYIVFNGVYKFVKTYKNLIFYLGFIDGNAPGELPLRVFPYVAHCFALTVFSVLMIHVQVATRLLASSSPVVYWFCASKLSPAFKDTVEREVLGKLTKKSNGQFYESYSNRKSKWKTFILTESFNGYSLFIKYYFLSYFVVGTVLFSNYLPWT